MIQFKKIIVHNFGSYSHSEVSLQNKGFCLVTGKNEFKKDNAHSNGSGKSFLWNAICYVLPHLENNTTLYVIVYKPSPYRVGNSLS